MLDLPHLLRFGLRLRDLHFLLLDALIHRHAVVFLLLQQQPLQPLRVLLRKLNFAQQHFFHFNGIVAEPRRDDLRSPLPKFFALDGENVAHHIIRSHLAEHAGHHRSHNLLINRLRQICLHVIKPPRIDPIPHRHRQPDLQPFARLHIQHFQLLARPLSGRSREHFVAHIIELSAVDQRQDEMRPGVKRSRPHPGNLADAHGRLAIRYYQDAAPSKRRKRRGHHKFCRRRPPNCAARSSNPHRRLNRAQSRHRRRCSRDGSLTRVPFLTFSRRALVRAQQPPKFECEKNIVNHQPHCDGYKCGADRKKQKPQK